MRSSLLVAGLCTLAFLPSPTSAQPHLGAEQATVLNGSPTGRSIPAADMLYRKTIWRTIDLREKQNRPFFASGHQLASIIIDAVKRGELQPYLTDSVQTPLAVSSFREKLVMPGTAPVLSSQEQEAGFGPDLLTSCGDDASTNTVLPSATAYEYLPRQLYQVEMREDLVFDKRRSRMYHQIQSLTLLVPATETAKGYDVPIASFRYADLLRVFRNNPDVAIWYNPANQAQHKNLADAFELWLFSSTITKVSNPDDKSLADLFGGGQRGILAAQQAAADLIEFEDNLWSH